MRGDLVRILHDLIDTRKDLDLVLIETTGMADPGPVVQTFFVEERVQNAFRMDSIITMVDAKHMNLTEHRDEAQQQIAFADVLLLSKIDLVQRAERDQLIDKIRQINDVPILPCEYGRVDLDKIINVGGFDLDRVLEHEPAFLQPDDNHHRHGEKTDEQIVSVGIVQKGAVDFDQLNRWIQSVLASLGPNIYRMKGILNVHGEDDRYVFQGVHMVRRPVARDGAIDSHCFRRLTGSKTVRGRRVRSGSISWFSLAKT